MKISFQLVALLVLYSFHAATPVLAADPPKNFRGLQQDEDDMGVDEEAGCPPIEKKKPPRRRNPCSGKKPDLADVQCIVDAMVNVGPQSGVNVTKGYQGSLEVDHLPITTPFWMNGMCAVNVHFRVGSEHYSLGEYDENGKGPNGATGDWIIDDDRVGFLCNQFNESDPRFTTPYEWKHCRQVDVGQTYEVRWPHSAAGACGTPDQFQTPFYDGLFCVNGIITDTASQLGMQSQTFTVINDEDYYYPDLMRGMIIDGDYGQDIAYYSGSSGGDRRSNEICSQFTPMTFQVDRKCQLISASSFDKMCADMKAQRDDMTSDLDPHGSRELVSDILAANNQNRNRRNRRRT